MSGYSYEVLADGPVAYFPMTETTNGMTVDTVSGVTAVLFGSVTNRSVPYPDDRLRDFDGAGSYLYVDPADMGGIYWNGGDYTAEWWAIGDQFGQDGMISQRSGASSDDQGLSIFAGTSGVGWVNVDMGNSGTRSGESYQMLPNELHHYVFTYDTTENVRRLYVDSVQVSYTSGKSMNTPTVVPPMYIGILGGNASYAWDGGLGQVSLYRKRLSDERIRMHYLASGVEGSLVYAGSDWKRKPLKYFDGTVWRPVALREVV